MPLVEPPAPTCASFEHMATGSPNPCAGAPVTRPGAESRSPMAHVGSTVTTTPSGAPPGHATFAVTVQPSLLPRVSVTTTGSSLPPTDGPDALLPGARLTSDAV